MSLVFPLINSSHAVAGWAGCFRYFTGQIVALDPVVFKACKLCSLHGGFQRKALIKIFLIKDNGS